MFVILIINCVFVALCYLVVTGSSRMRTSKISVDIERSWTVYSATLPVYPSYHVVSA